MKVAFIGAGYMTSEHLKAFASHREVQLVGIHSRTAARAVGLAEAYPSLGVFDGIAALYERTKADVVVVAVNELELRQVCESAFKFPWKILLEKPAGYDLEDAQRILQMAQEQQAQVYVALNRRHYSSTTNLLERLAQQSGPRFIHVLDQEDQVGALKHGQPELVVKNWMYANSIHLIDYLSFLGRGEITGVEQVVPWQSGVRPCHVVAKVSYTSGDIGLYEAAWNRPGPWSVTVTTNEARFELRPVESVALQNLGSRKLEPLPVHPWDVDFKPGLRRQVEEIVRLHQGLTHALPSLAEAFASMTLVSRIYRPAN